MRRLSIGNASAAALLLTGSLWAQIPEIAYDSAPNFLKLPEHVYLGEAVGVATNSKGNIFVYTRTGSEFATFGASRTLTHGGSRLFEFDSSGKYVREMGQGLYAFLFGQAVRVARKGGVAVLTMPAYQWMFSYHDRAVGNLRRYTRNELNGVVRAAGFAVIALGLRQCLTDDPSGSAVDAASLEKLFLSLA